MHHDTISMNRYLPIILCFLLCPRFGYAQTSSQKLDSLTQWIRLLAVENPQKAREAINKAQTLTQQLKSDESKIAMHCANAEFYITNNLLPQGSAHLDSASSITNANNNAQQQINIMLLRNRIATKSGDKKLANSYLDKASDVAIKNKEHNELTKIRIIQAEAQKDELSLTQQVALKKQALAYAKKNEAKPAEAECLRNIGSTYWQAGRFNEALEYYYKSLIVRESVHDTLGIIQTLKNIGITYRELGQYEKGIESLDQALNLSKSTINKVEEAEILNLQGSLHFRFNRFDEAIKLYTQSLSIRTELELIRSQVASHENIARAQAQKSMYNRAIDHLSIALELQSQIVDPLAEASTLTEIGNINLQKGNVAEALRRYLMALKIRQSFGKDEDIAKSLTNIGLAYRRLGMYKSAIKYLEQAHKIVNQKVINTSDAAYILQNLGHIYTDQKLYRKALNIYKEALQYKEKAGDNAGVAKILKNIAQAQIQMRQLNNARASLSQALTISKKLNDAKDIADIYNEMGNVERQASNTGLAIRHFEKAAEQYKSLSNHEGKALCIRKVGEMQIIQKKFRDAEQNIDASIKTGSQIGNNYLKLYGYLAKHDLYKAQGNYKLALQYYTEYTSIRDSLESLKRNEANLEAQLDLELDQKKTEIKVMEAEVETLRQKAELDKANMEKQRIFRNFLVVIILLAATLAGAAILALIQNRRHANALEEKIDEIRLINEKLTQSEAHLTQTVQTKDKLFSIIAHDLRSPFTALIGLTEVLANNTEELSTAEISEYSKHINQSATGVLALTDNLLSWSRSQTGKLTLSPSNHDLKGIIEGVVEVASVHANEKGIAIKTHIETGIDVYADYDTLSTAIRNLVSNAIKFTPTGGSITIKAKQTPISTTIEVSDTGIGIKPENLSKLFKVDGLTTKGTNQESGTGLGLMLCKEFVERNNGKIRVDSTLGLGTTFTIDIQNTTHE